MTLCSRYRATMLPPALALALLLAFVLSPPAHAAKPVEKAAPKSAAAPAKTTAKPRSSGISSAGAMTGFASGSGVDLPEYVEPPAYSVDLVIHSSETGEIVMKRFVDEGRIRTDITAEGQDISMIEMGDEKGTSYTVMAEQKMVFKQTREAMEAMTKGMSKQPDAKPDAKPDADEAPEMKVKVEDLGDETLDGRVVKKLRMSAPEGSALGWFDKATGAPIKMESTTDGKTGSIEWRNMKVGAQPAKLYVIPKDYQVQDMEQIMAQMKSMGGAGALGSMGGLAGMAGKGGMAGMPGMGGVPGMGGMPGMGGGLRGMAGGMGENFGAQMGGQIGTTLGASLGGPIGAFAGNYIGGKIGGMIGRKAVNAVLPGK